MDFLPYIDRETDAEYDFEVEKLMQGHLTDQRHRNQLHPEAQRMLSRVSIPSRPFYEAYSHYDDGKGWKRKRKETEDFTLRECRKKQKGIDMNKYDIETDDLESLGVIDSYLKHQSLVLQNMNETALTQWAVNNDYVEKATENLQDRINNERKQLDSLNKYRESIQSNSESQLRSIKNAWRQQLIRNVEKI